MSITWILPGDLWGDMSVLIGSLDTLIKMVDDPQISMLAYILYSKRAFLLLCNGICTKSEHSREHILSLPDHKGEKYKFHHFTSHCFLYSERMSDIFC